MSEEHEEDRSNWSVHQWIDYAIAGNKDLEGANLEGADLRRANLDGAKLEGANIDGADLGYANLYGANGPCGHDIDDLRKRVAGF